jgi:hypothetical protein
MGLHSPESHSSPEGQTWAVTQKQFNEQYAADLAAAVDLFRPTVADPTTPLSRETLRAIRTADQAVFFHLVNRDGGSWRGVGLIRFIRRPPVEVNPYGEEYTYGLMVPSRIITYNQLPDEYANGSAFAMVGSFVHNAAGTWRSLLRVGDTLSLEWRANGNGYTAAAGLFADDLLLHVNRPPGKDGKVKQLHFNVQHSICPDNTARMIQRDGAGLRR